MQEHNILSHLYILFSWKPMIIKNMAANLKSGFRVIYYTY